METDRSQKSDTEGSVASDLSWLLSLNQKSLTDGGSITGSITLDALYNPESYDANAAPRPKSKQHKAPRRKTAAESMGLIRGAKNYRLNSPYLPQPRPSAMLADEEEQLLFAAQAASPEGKGGKKGKPVSKSKTPASPITKMYQALSRRMQQREVSAHDPELQQQLLAKAAKIIHTAAGKETHKRMMLLVHAHTDKKPFSIPKIDASAEFGGSARSTDERYAEYYKYKLGINDRQKDEEPLYHEEHVLHFRDKPVELQASDDSPSINRDPLYRIMREQAELTDLLRGKGKASKIKSVDSTPAPAFIEANAKYVMTTAIIAKLAKMQKPSTEVWCTVRAVYLLMLAFYEHVVRNHPAHCLSMLDMKDGKGIDMQSYSASGSASIISSQEAGGAVAGVAAERRAGGEGSSPRSLTSAAGDDAAGNATGSAASAAATAADPLAEDYSATRSRKFWKSLAAKAKEMGTTVHNVSRTFSWDLFRDLLQYPSEFMHSLGDIEAGELSVPKVFPIVRVAATATGSGSRQVAWNSGSFYRSAERDDRLLGALRVVVGTGVFHPTSTFKTAPCVSVLCSWARSVVAGIFSGRMIINRTISKFPRMSSQGGYDPNKSLDSSLDGSLDTTLLASALMNISQTLPDTALPDASVGGPSTTAAAAAVRGINLNNAGSSALSPQKRVGHFIETATLQSSVLHEDLPDAIMSVTQAQNAHGAYVPHQINSELDNGTPLHVLAYVPAMRFPANEAALLDTHLPECSVFDVAILLGRPCDRVDVLLGDALQRDSVNEEVAMRYFQKKVMLKSRSPLHRVLVPPYAPADLENLNESKQPGVVSFAQIRKAKKGGHGHGSGSDVKSSNGLSPTPPAVHSLKDLLAGTDGAAEDGVLLESTEDALFEFVRRCFNAYPSAETVPANVLTSKLEKPGPTLVLIKGLNHVFQCPKYQTSYDDKKFSRTIMLVPPETQSSASISPYACVSRFVCMIAHGERSRTAFQTALRLSKPGDLLFLVHVLRRTKTGPYDEASAQDLARQYQKLGFNLEIVAEDEVAPHGTADNLQLGKALVNAAAAHAPTHMVLGSDHDDADFALFQNSMGGAGGSASVVEGVIRQEKFLCSTYHDSENARRPVLVLGAAV